MSAKKSNIAKVSILIGIILSIFPIMSFAQDSTTVSHELKELVVKDKRARVEDDKVIFVPNKKEKNLSNSPTTLLEAMHLPMLKVTNKTVSTLGGESVALFINGAPMSETDMATFWPSRILRVEYIPNPNDPQYAGAKYVINFILKQYEIGSVTRIDASQELPNNGDYTVASRLEYKRLSFGLKANASYSRDHIQHETGNEIFSDLYYNNERTTVRDGGIAEGDFGLVLALLAGQLAVTVGALVSTGIGNIILTKAGLGVNIEMVNNFLERLARFPLSFFDRKVSSDFVQKINDQSRIKDFLLSFPNTVFFTFFSLAIFSYLLFHFSPLIFAIFMSISILEIGWNALFLNKRKTLDYALFTNYADNRNHAYELTGGMSDLKVNNAETSRINKWKETQQAINDTSLKSSWLSLGQGAGQSIISRIKELSVTGIGAYMVISGDMTLGVLMSLGYITGRLAKPFDSISSTMTELQDSLLSFQRIEDVLGDDTEYRGSEKYTSSSISFDNVWFKYPGSNSPYVIKNLTLEIHPGEVIALVGESGCGKSTLIKLMLGFYIPDKGQLDLSGIPVGELDNSDWLRHCGAVMQEGKIFSDSILANISLSDNTPDVARAWDMLDKVGLKTFVEHLPMKIYTRLGVAGIELSGGQKQRLMIARALYKNPDILFLDEATSSLDAINEHMIVDQISNIGRGHTIIIAAHRLSTIRNADKIVFLKDGEITEVGTHDELLSRRGDYWNLVRHQLQAEKA